MKTCKICKHSKDLSEYYNHKASKDGKYNRCKKCDNKARKQWELDNKDKAAYSSRNKTLKYRYGIGIPEYNKMLESQGHKCAICNTSENKVAGVTHSFSVDHCHSTGEIRGLLCNRCNRGLGMLGDSIESIKKAVKYLEKGNKPTRRENGARE